MHTYVSAPYNLVSEEPREDRSQGRLNFIWPKAEWTILHDNSSNPNGTVIIRLRSIDGERIGAEDPRYAQIELPFGLLAEFVGYRVCCDRIISAERAMTHPRSALELLDQEHKTD